MRTAPILPPTPSAARTAPSALIAALSSVSGNLIDRKGDLLLSLVVSTLAFTLLHGTLLFSLTAGVHGATVAERTPLSLSLQRGAGDRPVQAFLSLLLSAPPVRSVAFVTKEQRYERERRLHADDLPFLERYVRQNPLADTAVVTLRSFRDADAFLTFLKHPVFQSVLDPTFPWTVRAWQETVSDTLIRWRTAHILLLGALAGSVILVLASAFLGAHLRLVAMHRRVAWQIVSGAEPLVIRRPFVMETVVLLLVATLLSLLFLLGCGAVLRMFLFPVPSLVPLSRAHVLSWLLFFDTALLIGGTFIAVCRVSLFSHGTHIVLRGTRPPRHRRR